LNQYRVMTTAWRIKSKAVRKALSESAPAIIRHVAQKIYDEADKNLKGPSSGVRRSKSGRQYPKTPPKHPLKMPIRRITGKTAESLQIRPATNVDWYVYADPQIAPWAKYLHDGTRYIKARHFIGDPVRNNKASMYQLMDSTILNAVRAVGK